MQKFETNLDNYFQNFINVRNEPIVSFQNVEHGKNFGHKFSDSAEKMEY